MRGSLNILFFFALALSACSKPSSAPLDSPSSNLVHIFQAGSVNEAKAIAAKSRLTCRDSAHCPSEVGMLLGRQEKELFSCTAFLVADDMVLTNSHCIPPSVKQLPDLCPDRVKIILPAANGFAEQSFACKKLVGRSPAPNDLSPDLALIQLSGATARPLLPINRDGLEPGENFSLIKVDPTKESSGEIVVESCTTLVHPYLFPGYDSASSPQFAAKGCHLIPGNSGSPFLNSAGEAVGAVQLSMKPTEEQTALWRPYLEAGEKNFLATALGTSLRCLGTSLKDFEWNPECAPFDPDDLVRPRVESLVTATEWNSLLLPYLRQSELLRWESEPVSNQAFERLESLKPACMMPANASLSVSIPLVETRLSLNPYLEAKADLRVRKEEIVKLDLAYFSERDEGEVQRDGRAESLSVCR